jgi:SAM-dependent methyltransferase
MKTTDIEHQFGHRDCEVCRAAQPRLLYRQRFAQMSEGSLLGGYNVVTCEKCGFCFADRLPDQSAFDRYYRDMSKYEQPAGPVEPSSYDLERFRGTVKKLQSFTPRADARILEIGCATGLLLSLLKDAGFTNVAGVDPSPACAEVARRQYRVPVQCASLSDDLAAPATVDLLILIGVLEHIRDLRTALAKLSAMLAPGGRVFITVPDASRYATGEDAPFQEFSVEHINFFGPSSLANLMAAHGFRTIYCEQAQQRQNVRTVTPVVHVAFELLPPGGPRPQWTPDHETAKGLEQYIAQSRRDNDAIQPALDKLVASQRSVIIWGAGAHTLRLLATSRLAQANLVAIVDSNPRYQGKTVNGVPILLPDAIRDTPGTILISSRPFQQNIQRQIHETMRLTNDVLTLYQFNNEAHA